MKCPRCSAVISTPPDAAGVFVCPGCGIRLKRVPAVGKPDAARGESATASSGPAFAASAEIDSDALLARLDAPASPTATLPPGNARKPIPRPDEAPARPDALAKILAELQVLRRTQEEMLALLRARPAAPSQADELAEPGDASLADGPGDEPPAPLRSRRRKTVLLIDDDENTRRAALAALQVAEVPTRTANDGNAGLAALAGERPDVIVMELGMGGAMPGKDVINLIKATMEWVDIPIVLYTRVPVAGQREARTIHGADELVPKDAPGAGETLAAKVVALFRKG